MRMPTIQRTFLTWAMLHGAPVYQRINTEVIRVCTVGLDDCDLYAYRQIPVRRYGNYRLRYVCDRCAEKIRGDR